MTAAANPNGAAINPLQDPPQPPGMMGLTKVSVAPPPRPPLPETRSAPSSPL